MLTKYSSIEDFPLHYHSWIEMSCLNYSTQFVKHFVTAYLLIIQVYIRLKNGRTSNKGNRVTIFSFVWVLAVGTRSAFYWFEIHVTIFFFLARPSSPFFTSLHCKVTFVTLGLFWINLHRENRRVKYEYRSKGVSLQFIQITLSSKIQQMEQEGVFCYVEFSKNVKNFLLYSAGRI